MSHSITQVFGDYVLVEASTDLDGGKMVLNYKKKETGFFGLLPISIIRGEKKSCKNLQGPVVRLSLSIYLFRAGISAKLKNMGMQWKIVTCSTRILHVTLLRKKAGNIPWYLKMEYCGCLIKIFGWYPKILRVKVKKVSFSSLLLFNKPYNYVYHEY